MAVPDGVVRFPHAASPRARLAAVDVERGLVGAAVTLRTRLVLVLEHLDTCNIQSVNINISAANRLIGDVVQSRRRPLLGPSPG